MMYEIISVCYREHNNIMLREVKNVVIMLQATFKLPATRSSNFFKLTLIVIYYRGLNLE